MQSQSQAGRQYKEQIMAMKRDYAALIEERVIEAKEGMKNEYETHLERMIKEERAQVRAEREEIQRLVTTQKRTVSNHDGTRSF